MPRIPPELAETLRAVVDEGTLDAAARMLHVTPSAVSQRIKALEEIVGRVVLVRAKPARATPEGEAVVRFARQVALLQHDAAEALGTGEGAAADAFMSVPLAVNADSLATWFLGSLVRVSAARQVVFDLHRDDQDFTAGLLEAGTVMGAVTSRATPVAGCRVVALGAMRYEAVATPQFAARWFSAAGADRPATADLEHAPVIDFDRRDDLQTRWLRARGADAGLPPRHRIPASTDFAEAIRAGLGWGLLPRLQSQRALDDGELVLLGGDPIDVPLHWQQWNLRSSLLDAVAADVVAEGRRVLTQHG